MPIRKPLVLTSAADPVTPDPGVYYDTPWEEYQSWDAFSKSMVGAALKSGAHLDHYIRNDETSPSLTLGSLVDTLILEPQFFERRFAVQPSTYKTTKTTGRGANKVTEEIKKPWNLNSHTCKAIAAEIAESGKQIVSEADLAKAKAIHLAVMSNASAALAVTEGKRQVSLVWKDEKTGVLCKGRPDIVTGDSIVDLKTARDASPEDFSRAVGRFLYHVQGWAYTDAWKALTGEERFFRLIVAETSETTEEPAVGLYELDHVSIVAGGLMFRRALERVAVWLRDGIEGLSPWWEPIEAPRWIVDREINMSSEEVEL